MCCESLLKMCLCVICGTSFHTRHNGQTRWRIRRPVLFVYWTKMFSCYHICIESRLLPARVAGRWTDRILVAVRRISGKSTGPTPAAVVLDSQPHPPVWSIPGTQQTFHREDTPRRRTLSTRISTGPWWFFLDWQVSWRAGSKPNRSTEKTRDRRNETTTTSYFS